MKVKPHPKDPAKKKTRAEREALATEYKRREKSYNFRNWEKNVRGKTFEPPPGATVRAPKPPPVAPRRSKIDTDPEEELVRYLIEHPEVVEAERLSRSLREFAKEAWAIVEPANPLVWGWHLDAVAEHLEALYNLEIRDLLINIPPRFSKSTMAAVIFPAWVWTKRPSFRHLFSSYAGSLALRDSTKTRRVIESPWYRARWGHLFSLSLDQNTKGRFENDKTGYRIAVSVGGAATGEGGDLIACDDPHSALEVLSDAERNTALTWWDETMSTRVVDPRTVRRLVIMQRLHTEDLSGHLLAKGGYEHLLLPMHYDPKRSRVTVTGFRDPRTKPGELLDPVRFPEDEVIKLEHKLGPTGAAGQLEQEPAPRGGRLFKVDKLVPFYSLKEEPVSVVRYWDKAATEGDSEQDTTSAESAGVKMGWLPTEKKVVILDVVHGMWSSGRREELILETAKIDGIHVTIGIEQEPGSGGKESAEATQKRLIGYTSFVEKPQGDKVVRADPLAVQVELGQVGVLMGASWVPLFINQMRFFPAMSRKDMIDGATGAFKYVAANALDGGACW